MRMETKPFLKGLSRFSNMMEVTFRKISQNLDFENPLPGRNIDAILENPEDKRKLDDAVEYLKQHSDVRTKEVVLSDNQTLTISIS